MPDNGNGFPIVGAKFRPPALAVLAHIAPGTALIAEREPTNEFDPNAIKVLVASIDVPPSGGLEIAIQNYGKDLLDVYEQRFVHLGYIPRTDAVALADAMDNAQRHTVRGVFAQNLTGQPRIKLDLAQLALKGDDESGSRSRESSTHSRSDTS